MAYSTRLGDDLYSSQTSLAVFCFVLPGIWSINPLQECVYAGCCISSSVEHVHCLTIKNMWVLLYLRLLQAMFSAQQQLK
jgi:hypothetical protein